MQAGMVEGDNPEEVKQKTIKGLLNKLTPEKFDNICGGIVAVGYESEETLSGLVDQVLPRPPFLPHALGPCAASKLYMAAGTVFAIACFM